MNLFFLALLVTLSWGQCLPVTNFTSNSPFILGSDSDYNGTTQYTNNLDCWWTMTCPLGMFAGAYYNGQLANAGDTLQLIRSDMSVFHSVTGTFLTTPFRGVMMRDNVMKTRFRTDASSVSRGFEAVVECFTAQCSNNRSSTDVITQFPSRWITDYDGMGTLYPLREQENCLWNFLCPQGQFFRVSVVSGSVMTRGNFALTSISTIINATNSFPNRALFANTNNASVSIVTGVDANALLAGSGADFIAECFVSQCSANISTSNIFSGGSLVLSDADGAGSSTLPGLNEKCSFVFSCPADQYPYIKILGDPFPGSFSVKAGALNLINSSSIATEMSGHNAVTAPNGLVVVNFSTPISGGNSTGGLNISFDCYVSQCRSVNASQVSAPVVLQSDSDGVGSTYSYANNENCSVFVVCARGLYAKLQISGALDSGKADVLRIRDGNGTQLANFSGSTIFNGSAVSSSNTAIVQFTSNMSGVGSGWTVTAQCIYSICPQDPQINAQYATRPRSLEVLASFGLERSTVICFPSVVGAGNITWCRATLKTTCGTLMGDAADTSLLQLTACSVNNTVKTPLTLTNATFVQTGVYEFGFTPYTAGVTNVTVLVGVRPDEGSKQFATFSTTITVLPGQPDFTQSTSACIVLADGVSSQCTVHHRDAYGNDVSSCTPLLTGQSSDGFCNVLSP